MHIKDAGRGIVFALALILLWICSLPARAAKWMWRRMSAPFRREKNGRR